MRSAPVMAAGRLPTNWPCVRYSILAANTHCHGRVDYVSFSRRCHLGPCCRGRASRRAGGGAPDRVPCLGAPIDRRIPIATAVLTTCRLAVGVTWALAAGDAPAAALAGRRRTAYLDPAHRSVAEFVVEPPDQHRRE